MNIYIYKYDIVFQEVPGEISLAFYVCGCPLKCPGCHSPELWTEKTGVLLTLKIFDELIHEYQAKISCVLFLGGEWREAALTQLLQRARAKGLLTALYTGLDEVSQNLLRNLDYLKTGPWIEARGGLASPNTNQTFRDLRNNKVLNYLFQTK